MKTSKNNDNRFTKDVLLHQIFQEITDEHRETSTTAQIDDFIPTTQTTSSIRYLILKWIFIVIFVISIAYIWIYTVTKRTQSHDTEIKSENNTSLTNEQIIQHKEVNKFPDVLKEEAKNTLTPEETDTIQFQGETPPEIKDTKTEREKAKEALLMQMQN